MTRVHGPFVTDQEVEKVVEFLREQGEPAYVESVTEAEDDDGAPICRGCWARRPAKRAFMSTRSLSWRGRARPRPRSSSGT